MYNIHKIKKNVNSFRVIDGQILEIIGGSLFLNDIFIDDKVDSYNYTLYNSKIIYLKNGQTFVDNITINKTILVDTKFQNCALFSFDFNVENFTLGYQFINLSSSEVIYDLGRHSNLKSTYIKNESFQILNFGDEIYCFSGTDDFTQNWKLEIEVKKLFGMHNNALLVTNDNHTILLINPISGDILFKWSELPGFIAGSTYNGRIPNSSNFVLDDQIDRLIGVFHTYYFEIDLRSKEVSFYQLKDELSKYGISDFRPFNNNPFSQDHLFLTTHTYKDDFPNVDLSSVIALNRESKKIDWCHTFTESGLGTNIPQISSTHLYQKDLDNNLHIFERQDQLT